MEYSAVMPNIISGWFKAGLRDVALSPFDRCCPRAQSFTGDLKRLFGEIEDGYVLITSVDKIVDEGRFPATNVDDRTLAPRANPFD